MKKTTVFALIVFGMAAANSASADTQLFFDDFTGTALDTSQWSVFVDALGEYHWPYVADGLLHSQGYHTRIDSIPTFAPMGQSVMARARIRLAGEYHQFGFGVNPNERAGPITGYYFDTLSPAEGGDEGREGYVRALAWFQPASGSPVNLLDVEIPVTWYEFHEFAVERTPSEVIYSIDGQEVARVADAFEGALPVGVWNARWDLMQTDWVEVSQVSEPEPPIEALVDINPDSLNKNSKGQWVTVYITLPAGYDVARIDASTIAITSLTGTSCQPDYHQAADLSFAPQVGDRDEDGIPDLTVKFSRQELIANLCLDDVAITVEGKLVTGEKFKGIDHIRVIDRGK